MRFSKIRLENWRNFASVDVSVENRTFLVGQNASGKSNFLDALRFLRDIATSDGGLQSAINRRNGVGSLRNINISYPDLDITLDVELSEDDDVQWRYRLVFSQDNVRRPTLKEEKVWRGNELIVDRPDKADTQDNERLQQTVLEQTFANYEFRAVADFFKRTTFSHIIPDKVRNREYSTADSYIEQMAETDKRSLIVKLERIQRALRVAVPQLEKLEWHQNTDDGREHIKVKNTLWRGAWETEQTLSDGTLRLIGMLWDLQSDTGPLLLEEPELSLHPGLIRRLPELMYVIQREQNNFRQIFISTHSLEILADLSISPNEVLLFRIGETGTEIQSGRDLHHIQAELDAGFTIADIVLPETDPTR